MHLEKKFEVECDPDAARRVCTDEETLLELFPETRTEIVAREGDRLTLRSHYTALGQQGTATFHFHLSPDDDVRFEKVCDGRVWRELSGRLSFRATRGGTQVKLSLEGRTKPLVPEFTIKGPMHDQLEQMTRALRRELADA